MAVKKGRFHRQDVEVIEKTAAYRGFLGVDTFTLKHQTFAGGWSEAIQRERLERVDAAAAILYDPHQDLVGLVEQFRIGALDSELGPWCLEVVAGMVEEGETPEQVILREIHEEASIMNAKLTAITSYYSSPGVSNEKIHLYCALVDLSAGEGIHGLAEEHEDIYLHVCPAQSVFDDMLNRRVNNAATLIGLQWLKLHRESLRLAAQQE